MQQAAMNGFRLFDDDKCYYIMEGENCIHLTQDRDL
jgi:hypothetical protein